MLKEGLSFTSKMNVTTEKTALAIGSGDLPILATPALLALMENAAMNAVVHELEDGQSTVGGEISSSHVKPTGLGKQVSATATLIKVEGRKLYFRVNAHEDGKLLGEGTHLRFVVDKVRFLSKLT